MNIIRKMREGVGLSKNKDTDIKKGDMAIKKGGICNSSSKIKSL